MSAKTGIEWTDSTWNPIRGCTRVSEGCRNCYAERQAMRASGPGAAYEGLVAITNGHPQWTGKIQFVEKHLLDPLSWKKPRRVFVNSMSDLFHEQVTDEMRDKIFAVMALCPQHTFQVLTKRPKRMLEYLDPACGRIASVVMKLRRERGDRCLVGPLSHIRPGAQWWPLANVWLGVSVENQKTADQRIPLLLQTSAAVRFISAEPLLGRVTLEELPSASGIGYHLNALSNAGVDRGALIPSKLDWVICGGESGPSARPMHPDWARSLRDQCQDAGVTFFFKQWGEWAPDKQWAPDARDRRLVGGERARNKGIAVYLDGNYDTADCCSGTYEGFDSEAGAVEVIWRGKKAAGAELDGREWKQFPEPRP